MFALIGNRSALLTVSLIGPKVEAQAMPGATTLDSMYDA